MSGKHFQWESHHDTILKIIHSYCVKEEKTDVTINFEDGKIKAHKIILSACSAKLENIFKEEGNIQVCFYDISKSCMNYLIEFMYKGQVVVPSDALDDVLRAAEHLQIKGLQRITDSPIEQNQSQTQLSDVLVSSDHLQTGHNESISNSRYYGMPSSPVRKDRPLRKRPSKENSLSNCGNDNKSKNLPRRNRNSNDVLTSPVTSNVNISPFRKMESFSSNLKKESPSSSFSMSEKQAESSRKTKLIQNGENSESGSKRIRLGGKTRKEKSPNKVINPFARKSTLTESSHSSSTCFEDAISDTETVKLKHKKSQSESEVECFLVENQPIVLLDSLVESSCAQRQDLDESSELICSPTKQSGGNPSTSRRVTTPVKEFSSTDEDDTLPLKKKTATKRVTSSPKKKTDTKKGEETNFKIIKNPPPDKPQKPKKVEEYTNDLLTKQLNHLHEFCTVCFKYFKDIREHHKMFHKKIIRKKQSCKDCGKSFYHTKFFGFHKCVDREKD
nr:protein abrupt-like [Leptinotarsa decemlineata]